jgi:hypothetical protein
MVISLGRASFNLSTINVGLALEACLGATHEKFRVSPLRDRVFIFYVYSKEVGFMIRDLRKHIAKNSSAISICGVLVGQIGD